MKITDHKHELKGEKKLEPEVFSAQWNIHINGGNQNLSSSVAKLGLEKRYTFTYMVT